MFGTQAVRVFNAFLALVDLQSHLVVKRHIASSSAEKQ
jgi:hypothetical protein